MARRTYPLLNAEYVRDRNGIIWRVVRDGGMVTTADGIGILSGGIHWLRDNYGPLVPVETEGLTLSRLQAETAEWADRNYLSGLPHQSLLGVFEEAGELNEALLPVIVSILLGQMAHAQLKTEDGIRGTAEEHAAKAQDAIADLTIFLSRYCERKGWDYGQIVEETWAKVKQRDWTKNKMTGAADG